MWKSLTYLAIVTVISIASGSAGALDSSSSSGTWSCTCSGSGGCTTVQNKSGVSCKKLSGDSCTGTCDFSKTTSGNQPISPAETAPTTTTRPGASEPASAR
jgi:hypothetical protein